MEITKSVKMLEMSSNKYEEVVDLQNNCRSFYLNRVEATEQFKSKLQQQSSRKEKKQTSLSLAMDKLRSEMASLVDQDLSLMKQLLTMNESIEDLKRKRLYGVSKECFQDSECNLGDSSFQLQKTVSSLSIGSGYGSSISDDDSCVNRLSSKTYSYQDSEDSGCGE